MHYGGHRCNALILLLICSFESYEEISTTRTAASSSTFVSDKWSMQHLYDYQHILSLFILFILVDKVSETLVEGTYKYTQLRRVTLQSTRWR